MGNNKTNISGDVLQALLNLRASEECIIHYWTRLDDLQRSNFQVKSGDELTFVLQPSIVVAKKTMVGGVERTLMEVISFASLAQIDGLAEVVKGGGLEEITVTREPGGELVVSREKRNA